MSFGGSSLIMRCCILGAVLCGVYAGEDARLFGCPTVEGEVVGDKVVLKKGSAGKVVPASKPFAALLWLSAGFKGREIDLDKAEAYFVPNDVVAMRCPLDKETAMEFLRSHYLNEREKPAKAGRKLMRNLKLLGGDDDDNDNGSGSECNLCLDLCSVVQFLGCEDDNVCFCD